MRAARPGPARARRRRRRPASAAGTGSGPRTRSSPTTLPAAARCSRRRVPTTPAARPAKHARGSGPGCTKTGLPASSAASSRSAACSQANGVSRSVAGSCRPTKRSSASSPLSAATSTSPAGTEAQARKWSGSSRTPRCQASISGCASGRRRRSIPSGAERLRQAVPTPASWSAAMRVATSWPAGSTSYGGSPSVCSVQPRRYGARERARSRSTSSSGHRCWCTSTASGAGRGVQASDSASLQCSKWSDFIVLTEASRATRAPADRLRQSRRGRARRQIRLSSSRSRRDPAVRRPVATDVGSSQPDRRHPVTELARSAVRVDDGPGRRERSSRTTVSRTPRSRPPLPASTTTPGPSTLRRTVATDARPRAEQARPRRPPRARRARAAAAGSGSARRCRTGRRPRRAARGGH